MLNIYHEVGYYKLLENGCDYVPVFSFLSCVDTDTEAYRIAQVIAHGYGHAVSLIGDGGLLAVVPRKQER